jgi:hypothetical protein
MLSTESEIYYRIIENANECSNCTLHINKTLMCPSLYV